MPLEPGTRLGSYEIEGILGVGGMGEVYRAHDPRLNRSVALKILPPATVDSSDRAVRFKREAQAVAALNHPNIVTIYSVEEVNGTPLITMELVEGRTLGALIPPAGLPPDVLIRLAHGIADAVVAAHERGITHRDLKPGNVMVTPDGRVKVLDFGLAKFRQTAAGSESTTENLTVEGSVVGTVAYMSPEQVQGKSTDHRTDIFSLGVMLYEMATGERPFRGDTQVSVMSAILRDEPPLISDVRQNHPPALARTVRKCLQKEASRRPQTATDLRNDLDEALQELTRTGRASRRSLAQPLSVMMILGLLVALVVLFFATQFRNTNFGAFTVERVERLTTDGQAELAAMSSDGRYVVHVKEGSGRPSLWVRQTATGSDVEIVPPDDVVYNGVSYTRDNNYAYFATYPIKGGVATLFKIPTLGGKPKPILEDVDSGVTFSASGAELAFIRMFDKGTNLMVAGADGSNPRTLATLGNERYFAINMRPAWSPDGKTILAGGLTDSDSELHAVDVQSGQLRSVAGRWTSISGVEWMSDGQSFIVAASEATDRSNQVWQVEFPSGKRSRVTNDLATYRGVHLTADGRTLATVQAATLSQIWITNPSDPTATKQVTSGVSNDGALGVAWVPDGRVVFTSSRSGRSTLWIMNADGSGQRQLAVDTPSARNPAVTPDGKWVVFEGKDQSGIRIWRMNVDGSSPAPLTPGSYDSEPVVSKDGGWVYYTSKRGDSLGWYAASSKVHINGGKPVDLSRDFFPTDVASDGRLLGRAEEGGREVVAWHDPTGSLRFLKDIPLVFNPLQRTRRMPVLFTDGERALLYSDVQSGIANLWRRALTGGTPEQVTDFETDRIFHFAQSHDGRRLAVSKGRIQSDVVLLVGK